MNSVKAYLLLALLVCVVLIASVLYHTSSLNQDQQYREHQQTSSIPLQGNLDHPYKAQLPRDQNSVDSFQKARWSGGSKGFQQNSQKSHQKARWSAKSQVFLQNSQNSLQDSKNKISLQGMKLTGGNQEERRKSLQRMRLSSSNQAFPQDSQGSLQKMQLPNLGCYNKVFSEYRPIDVGVTYHHPSIVHYAKLSQDNLPVQLTFLEYMSIMSAYKFLRPKAILIHTYTQIEGKYWDKIQSWTDSFVEARVIPPVTHFDSSAVQYIQHAADYIKLRALLQYGGIISDFDLIVINASRIHAMQRISECVLSRGGPVGQFVNAGFTSCVKNSTFVRLWLSKYHETYRPSLYVYNSSLQPLRILEDKNSTLCHNVFLDSTICLNPNATGEKSKWKKKGGVRWRQKTAAHHFYKEGDEKLLKDKNSLGDMLRHVMRA